MNKDEAEQVVKSHLTSIQFAVLYARLYGYRTPRAIQGFTGYQKCRVEQADVQLARILQGNTGLLNLYKNIYEVGVQNAQKPFRPHETVAPSRQIFDHLSSALNRRLPLNPSTLSFAKRIYLMALRHEKDDVKAVQLVKDCIDTTDLSSVGQPWPYLFKVFEGYISSLPKKTWELRDNEAIMGQRYRWNQRANQWEFAK